MQIRAGRWQITSIDMLLELAELEEELPGLIIPRVCNAPVRVRANVSARLHVCGCYSPSADGRTRP